ncbi:MAG TPA: transcriptional regulator GcvA [Myxococcota bacterium]|nr:transcriptional regulator GcvA [Myxococcota bacterium]
MKRRPRKLPPLNALRAFEAAARHLSFKRAAVELCVTPAAVSHQVRALEAQLGLALFARLHRALELTPAGARYLPALSEAFDRLDDATLALRTRPRTPRLVLSVVPSFGSNWLVPRLGGFRARHPAIDLTVLSSSELADFARDPVDVGIRFGPGGWPGVRADLLLAEEYLPVASPKLLRVPTSARGAMPRGGLRRPEDLRRYTLLHDETHDGWRAWLASAGVTGIDAERGVVFSDSSQLVAAAAAGQGVALARKLLAAPHLRARTLVRAFKGSVPAEFAYYVVSAESRAAEPAIRAFREWVIAESLGREP